MISGMSGEENGPNMDAASACERTSSRLLPMSLRPDNRRLRTWNEKWG